MPERFIVDEALLREMLRERPDCAIDAFGNADDLHRLISESSEAGILRAPSGLEILVYPNAVERCDVALVTVFSVFNPTAHVVVASEAMRRLASRDPWEADDPVERTVEIVDRVVELANGALADVRALEARAADVIATGARCPACLASNQLRVEYRHDVRGFGTGGELVLGDAELTEIVCLACGEEVEDVVATASPDRSAGGGEEPELPDPALRRENCGSGRLMYERDALLMADMARLDQGTLIPDVAPVPHERDEVQPSGFDCGCEQRWRKWEGWRPEHLPAGGMIVTADEALDQIASRIQQPGGCDGKALLEVVSCLLHSTGRQAVLRRG